MDVQPCDAVFGVVFSDLKPPFLGSGDSRGQIKHWHGVTSFLTEGLAPHPRSRKATRRLCAHVANRAVDVRRNTVLKTAVVTIL